jgi:uncharacterized protein (DUF302 family)
MRELHKPLIALFLLICPGLTLAEKGPYVTRSAESGFEEVMQNLRLAIQDRGLYINNEMHMAEMLERTGKDLGFSGQAYLKAESIEFCSAVLSRKMVEEDPRRVVNCPFIISVYVLPAEPGRTFVAYRAPALEETQASAVMREVAEMLQTLATAAVAW